MPMTITEKILASHSKNKELVPGQLISARVDGVLANDITAPISIKEFEKAGIGEVFDREKIYLVPDHFTPNKDIKSAEQVKMLRDFARKYKIKHFFEMGRVGIEHVILPEMGLVAPGELIIGADSHTCTYGAIGAFSTGVGSTDAAAAMISGEVWLKVPESIKFIYKGKLNKWVSGKDLILYTIGKIGVDGALYSAMEFTGEAIEQLSMDGRFTMCNMAIEAGAKNGIISFDEKTESYITNRVNREYKVYQSDADAKYLDIIEFDVSNIGPVVSTPHLPENVSDVREVNSFLDQVVIGSCTNGRIEDLRVAAEIFKGKKVNSNLRCIILPGSQAVVKQAIKEGIYDIFIDAECVISTPTCGPCLGGHMGILAKGERALSTTNRNFIGRMGSPESFVYLSNPAVAAASAIAGKIVHPDEILN